MIGRAVQAALQHQPARVIVLTDGQSVDTVPTPPSGVAGYMVNLAAYRPEVGYGEWNRVEGWSEAVLQWIVEVEKETAR